MMCATFCNGIDHSRSGDFSSALKRSLDTPPYGGAEIEGLKVNCYNQGCSDAERLFGAFCGENL
jgi:hypothetical protein